ncbi:MAG: alkaline phosphatase [Fibrobacteraceae bacterium]|nr:alkaline phosphatase [Fibrobacteraceae bacterium]
MNIHAILYSAFILCTSAIATPKNVILMISDGCGYNQIEAANLYQTGRRVAQIYESFPVKIPMSTWSKTGNKYDGNKAAKDATWVKFKPTDSAASATAFATGKKAYDSSIGMDMDKHPMKNLSETARKAGKSAGVVTTAPISHATPSAFVVHNESRNNYEDIANSMIFDSDVQVIFGAGHPFYDNDGKQVKTPDYKYIGQAAFDSLAHGGAKSRGGTWSFIETKSAFDSLAQGRSKLPERIVGIAQVYYTFEEARGGKDHGRDSVYQSPFNANVPTLATLAQGALRVLSQNEKGFFLMVEGGAVDMAAHDNYFARSIEEELDFDRAVDSVVTWIENHGGFEETLLIVTGDHETGYLTGPGGVKDSAAIDYKLINNGKGNMPGYAWNLKSHSNQLVPLFAKGNSSGSIIKIAGTDPVRGPYTDNAMIGSELLKILSAK